MSEEKNPLNPTVDVGVEESEEQAIETEKDLVAEANHAAAEMKELAQRVQAEFDNYRRRNAEAVKMARQSGENAVLSEIFSVTDNFERALSQVDVASREGINLIFKQVLSLIEKFGAEEIVAKGQSFDPIVHNAVMTVEDQENEGKVVEVLQKGYRRGKEILRTAMVKVAN